MLPQAFSQLLSSRRFLLCVAGILAVYFQHRFAIVVTEGELRVILMLAGAWVISDGYRADVPLPWLFQQSIPLAEKIKFLSSSHRFLAVFAGCLAVVGNEKLGLNFTEQQLFLAGAAISVWVISEGLRGTQPPGPTITTNPNPTTIVQTVTSQPAANPAAPV